MMCGKKGAVHRDEVIKAVITVLLIIVLYIIIKGIIKAITGTPLPI